MSIPSNKKMINVNGRRILESHVARLAELAKYSTISEVIKYWDSFETPSLNGDSALNEIYLEIWDYLNPDSGPIEFDNNFFATLDRCIEFLKTELDYKFSLQTSCRNQTDVDVSNWPFAKGQSKEQEQRGTAID